MCPIIIIIVVSINVNVMTTIVSITRKGIKARNNRGSPPKTNSYRLMTMCAAADFNIVCVPSIDAVLSCFYISKNNKLYANLILK